jgi:amidase
VARLLAAGATLAGKTITDELAFSLEGANAHDGTPRNPRAPARLPGGSSSGSASAVAGGVVDFAVGTDTGGSVRIPASFCGLFGMRPTHGAIDLAGVVPFAPSYDTIGFFARSAAVLAMVGGVLMPGPAPRRAARFVVAGDAFSLADPAVAAALRAAMPDAMREAPVVDVFGGTPNDWREAYRVLQGAEIWDSLGAWITAARPRFGPAIAPRFADAATITAADVAVWAPFRAAARERITRLLGADGVLVIPTAPTIAPLRDAPPAVIGDFYARALALMAIAGHSGLPEISVPVATLEGAPVGLSLVGAAGADLDLLACVLRHFGDDHAPGR